MISLPFSSNAQENLDTALEVTTNQLRTYLLTISPMNQNLFIVFEGIDGSGTSTQAELLKDYFNNQGKSAIISPEPSTGMIGKLIREAMQQPILAIQDKKRFDQQMAYLFAADRHHHLYNDVDGVFKLIEQDKINVITTRYYFSSLAYNCYNQEDFDFVKGLNQQFPNPDLVIYLDIPIDVSLARIDSREIKEVYENESKLVQVRANYQKLFANYPDLWLKIDGTNTKTRIHQQIINFIQDSFGSS